jgi:DNA-binding transcriptional LysR family regulator
MWEELAALVALRREGSTARAATALRITQSAVSKRISALQARIGVPVVERRGRGLILTPAGEELVVELEPRLQALRELVERHRQDRRRLRLGCAESLLAGQLPAALVRASAAASLELELHAHRGAVVLERVRAGSLELGISVDPQVDDLDLAILVEEPMALVPAHAPLDQAWTIETASLTWAALERPLARHYPQLAITGRLESFVPLIRLAEAGLAPALVPAGLACSLGVAARPLPPLHRRIALFGRRRAMERPEVQRLTQGLRQSLGAQGLPPG